MYSWNVILFSFQHTKYKGSDRQLIIEHRHAKGQTHNLVVIEHRYAVIKALETTLRICIM